MTIDADALLSGPRGRRLCLEYALAGSVVDTTGRGQDAATALYWAALALETGAVTLVSFSEGGHEPPAPPTVGAAEAAAALDTIEPDAPTEALLREALQRSVDAAKYWQPADGRDVLVAQDELTAPLRRIAGLIATAPAASWWRGPVDLADQWTTPWEGTACAVDAGETLAAWRAATLADEARSAAERPSDPTANWSGTWWSVPPHELVRTTRSLGPDGPAGLWWVEDSLGRNAAVATPVDAYPARVIELDGPEDWADLCRRHPLEVTASRRHDWFRVTGRDGRWVVPDWSAVAVEADGVHLTVRGYLTAATRLIDVGDGAASVLGGWNPDETYWFRGVAARPADAVRWHLVDDAWRRGS
ncbi:hypothetical protein [Microbacterium kyungheense]|uniref:Uncharacterized protein n=1 Tax=Microbacterium kyungheense TaxID=1263636 RepID=A0A543FLW6_9MICO|nr:hypothetical protein [Microbacterium kyungheense]TQM34716.1 hypothetical protein FB391_1006 [Microbacterium kyungheense]